MKLNKIEIAPAQLDVLRAAIGARYCVSCLGTSMARSCSHAVDQGPIRHALSVIVGSAIGSAVGVAELPGMPTLREIAVALRAVADVLDQVRREHVDVDEPPAADVVRH